MEKYFYLLIALVIFGAATVYLIYKMPKLKILFKIVYPLIIVFFTWQLFVSIDKPIQFQKDKDVRYQAVVDRLVEIRAAQEAYEEKNGIFATNFDELIQFIMTDSFDVVFAEGNVPDSLTEAQAVELGIVTRDSSKISIRDSLFPSPYVLDSLRYVPLSNGVLFEMVADSIKTVSEVVVQVFEARVHDTIILRGLDRQEIINLRAEKRKLEQYEGLKVGSIEEPNNNAGNWPDLYNRKR